MKYNAKINESTFMQTQETINESKNWIGFSLDTISQTMGIK